MNHIEIFKAEDGKAQFQVQFDNDAVWLIQQQMTLLFGQKYKFAH